MEDFLLNVDVTPHMVYLSIILIVIGKGLKDVPFINNWLIVWILLLISIIVNFAFFGISFSTFFEAFIATSLATTVYQVYKQTGEGIHYRLKK